MEYIVKQEMQPADWNSWFTTAGGRRSFDYGADCSAMTALGNAKEYLLQEQHKLCAYCQQKLESKNASIEHFIPKEHNKELSTNYYNLVVVCKSPPKDPETNRSHCDKEKQSEIITSLLFVASNSADAEKNNAWFDAYSDGRIVPRPTATPEHFKQAEAFIETVNLNHKLLKDSRSKDALDPYLQVYRVLSQDKRGGYWQNTYESILRDRTKPFRQYLLIVIGKKLGFN